MSILIKGMDMPKDQFYPVHATIYADGTVFTGHGIGQTAKEAVPVPPHGRLIDADALDESLGIEDQDVYVHWTLESAPTIIEAEEVEDNA